MRDGPGDDGQEDVDIIQSQEIDGQEEYPSESEGEVVETIDIYIPLPGSLIPRPYVHD